MTNEQENTINEAIAKHEKKQNLMKEFEEALAERDKIIRQQGANEGMTWGIMLGSTLTIGSFVLTVLLGNLFKKGKTN